MTFFRLLVRNLLYHRRGNFAVFLGVALGSAILTGALLVGDSLRGSLRSLALDQLGWVDQAMVTGRFFRADLAQQLGAMRGAAVILLQGSAAHDEHRAGKVAVIGCDQRFWPPKPKDDGDFFWQSNEPEVVLNAALARALKASVGDTVNINVQKAESIPRETLLGKRKSEDVLESISLKVRAILPDEGMARFTLKPTPEPVRNAFVPLRFLQEKLEIPGRANAVLLGGVTENLAYKLKQHLQPADWNLQVRTPEDRARAFVKVLDPRNVDNGMIKKIRWNGRVPEALAQEADAKGILRLEKIISYFEKQRNYVTLESTQMFLDPGVADAALAVAQKHGWQATPTLVYLADALAYDDKEVPYAVVAGIPPAAAPPADRAGIGVSLKPGEIVLARPTADKLADAPGTDITVSYFAPDAHNHLTKKHTKLRLRHTFDLQGQWDDPDWTPEFPGITDKLSISEWDNPPFPYDARRGQKAEEFWKRYRTTPQAYVALDTARALWASRFGKVTSVRIEPGTDLIAHEFRVQLMLALKPEQGGFVFQPVKELALKSGGGSTDFAVLFLAFSFFLIAAALLLVGLLFRLNMDRRGSEMGILLATGWTRGRVRRLLLGEGAVLAVVGGLVGLAGALLYGDLMLRYFRANWPGGENLMFLRLHAEPASFVIGYAAAVAVSLLTIVWATRVLGKLTPKALIAGATTAAAPTDQRDRGWARIFLGAALLGAAAALVAGMLTHGHEAQAGSFFASGALLLTGGLILLWLRLKRSARQSSPQPSLGVLGVRNAGRHAVRSMLTAGLLAFASFLIVAVEAFHKEAGETFHETKGGSGGFPLLAETDIPLFQDLNQPATRKNLGLPEWFDDVPVFPLRVRAGDDASCLNLYQPLRPRILGVPHSLVERGGFDFSAVLWPNDKEGDNPWQVLEMAAEDDAIPAFADANSAQWILKVPLGGTLQVTDEQGAKKKLKIVGLLRESIFQSDLLVSDTNFLKLYPRSEGFSFFLVGGPWNRAEAIQSALEKALGDQGFTVTPTVERLQAYLAVENTYLATFKALGGLGLLLGAVGLSIVLLRAVWERRAELGLMQALGFRRPALVWLIMAENVFLLVAGLGAGVVAALLAVAPHLVGSGAAPLWGRTLLLLALVTAVGSAAAVAAALSALRTPVLTALRRE